MPTVPARRGMVGFENGHSRNGAGQLLVWRLERKLFSSLLAYTQSSHGFVHDVLEALVEPFLVHHDDFAQSPTATNLRPAGQRPTYISLPDNLGSITGSWN